MCNKTQSQKVFKNIQEYLLFLRNVFLVGKEWNKYITRKFKNKLIILDNTCSHKNKRISK